MTRLALAPELRPARTHAGAALAALESASDAAGRAIEPVLADLLRGRVAERLGVVPPGGSTSAVTEREQACCDFADQFVVYVPGITEAHRDAVAAQLGQDLLLELTRALYVFDMTDRLRLSLGRLVDSRLCDPESGDGDDLAAVEQQPLGTAVGGLHAAAMQLHALDPVTTELVRLHCARYHDCKT